MSPNHEYREYDGCVIHEERCVDNVKTRKREEEAVMVLQRTTTPLKQSSEGGVQRRAGVVLLSQLPVRSLTQEG